MSLVQEAWMACIAASEPWYDNTALYKPLDEQILLGENAAVLTVQAYLRMCGLHFQVVSKSNAEFISPSGKLPVLFCGNLVISEPTPIAKFIKKKGLSSIKQLPETKQTDLIAYTELVNSVLVPAEVFVTWAHEETLKKITYKRYGNPYPWPLNHFLCWRKRWRELEYLESIGWEKGQTSLATVDEEVKRCCQALSQKLGKKSYFFDDKPTEFDALVFGHLYTIITTKLPDNRLAETVKSFNNLLHFCKNIDRKYFGQESLRMAGST